MLVRTIFTASILIALDRALKLSAVNYNGFFVVGGTEFGASFGVVKNFGIALSINLPLMIAIMFSVFILVYLIWMLYSKRKFMPKMQVMTFELIIAGGLSNVFDRLIYGYVIDYWSIFLFRKALAFNLADVMIGAGALMMLGFGSLRRATANQRVLLVNQATYDKIAVNFSCSREKPLWPEMVGFKKYIKDRDRILDIGCGSGRLLRLFDDVDVDYIGVDISGKLLEQARSKNKSVKFVQGDMLKLEFDDNSFDAVFMIASLNHLPACYHQQALLEAIRVLKPGGRLLMTNLNLWRFSVKGKTVWRYRSFNRDVMTHWNGKPLYYYAFTARELKRKCQKAGFNVKEAYYALGGKRAHFWNGRNIVLVGEKS